ncbi:indolethylamine N-methyltransferase-like isoform X2 [Ornithodoros turicata]|uniref:indolethylamine N-methyltransferase-like isoform X2 n=1 Tax=Ornithodoros turicata TaxID=34597 RepID=UPI0031390519
MESTTKLKTPDAEITNGASREGFPDYEDSHNSAHAQGYDSLEEYESYFSKIIVSTSEEARCSSSDDDKHKTDDEEQLVPCERIKEFLDPGVFTTSVYPSHIRELSIIVEDAYKLLKRGTVGGEWGLDLGCGPMLQYSLMLSDHVKKLVVANYLDQTKAIVEDWLKDDQRNMLNLNAVLQSVSEVTKHPPHSLKEQLRNCITDHVSCDLFSKENGKFLPAKYDNNEMFDVIVTSLLLEAVIQDLDTYAKIIKRISGLLKRCGHLLMNGVLGMTYWDMKAGKFNCVTLTKDNVEKVLKDCGFVDLEWTIVDREYFHSVSDYTKTFLVLARKP